LQYTERLAPKEGAKPREGPALTAALTPREADRAATGASARVVVMLEAISRAATGLTFARVVNEATASASLRLSAVVTT
tara:strand:+ start:302 stop:538 length:237 start_codon:yes stop_codon:yes gene_type:complete